MSTHDYIIADASGSAFLADLNLAVKALAENNSSATEPTVMYAHMWWADTTADILKKRNAANTGWISYLTLSTGMPIFFSAITNSLNADVLLTNTSNYFDGPSVSQGTSGTWFASGTVTIVNPSGIDNFQVKLWDGTTTIASTSPQMTSSGVRISVSLSGYIQNPSGNLRISVKDISSTNGKILYSVLSETKESTISCFRIG